MTQPARYRKSDEMLALVRVEPGLTSVEISDLVGVSGKTASNELSLLRQQGLIVSVRSRYSAVWTTPEVSVSLREVLVAQSKARKTAIEKASRLRPIDPEDEVDNHPPVQRVVSSWAPVREAPGPVSVFHLGAR